MPTLDWIGKDAGIRHHKEVPWTKVLHQELRLGSEWGEQVFSGRMTEELAGRPLHVNLHLGGLEGEVEIAELELTRYPAGTPLGR